MYSLLYVDGWDDQAQEMRGSGRCIDQAPALREAIYLYSIHLPSCRRFYGPGELVITNPKHERVNLDMSTRGALQTA